MLSKFGCSVKQGRGGLLRIGALCYRGEALLRKGSRDARACEAYDCDVRPCKAPHQPSPRDPSSCLRDKSAQARLHRKLRFIVHSHSVCALALERNLTQGSPGIACVARLHSVPGFLKRDCTILSPFRLVANHSYHRGRTLSEATLRTSDSLSLQG